MKIGVVFDMSGATDLMRQELPRAVPYIEAAALTGMAKRIQAEIKGGPGAGGRGVLDEVFDRPTQFTKRGFFMKPATKAEPVAEVFVPDSADGRGQGAREYLQPGVQDNMRRKQRRHEYLLTKAGWLPVGWVTIPGKRMKVDGHGNLPGSIYRQIVNVLQVKKAETVRARNVYAASQRRATKMGTDSEFFAVAPGANTMGSGGSWLPPGVYRRTGLGGKNLIQYLKFVKKADYKQRLDLNKVAQDVIKANGQAIFDQSTNQVITRFIGKVGK
jgi:hypothetical protein